MTKGHRGSAEEKDRRDYDRSDKSNSVGKRALLRVPRGKCSVSGLRRRCEACRGGTDT